MGKWFSGNKLDDGWANWENDGDNRRSRQIDCDTYEGIDRGQQTRDENPSFWPEANRIYRETGRGTR